MKEREISYERTIYKSYMKITSVCESDFDEKLILKNKISGMVSCEKCSVNGMGQYWYDITGMQALDHFCKMNAVEKDFITTLLLSICNFFEQMEWNLIDERCLRLEPEMIFVGQMGEKIAFVLYPEIEQKDTFVHLNTLMEYLLSKMDHSEKTFVSWIYEIYEFMLSEEYSIVELKNKILQKRIEELDLLKVNEEEETLEMKEESEDVRQAAVIEERKSGMGLSGMLQTRFEKLRVLFKNKTRRIQKDASLFVVYPEDEVFEEEITVHPTVCVSMQGCTRGFLVYEGLDGYSDFEIKEEVCVIGKNHKVKLCIEKDTISQFHAKIEYVDNVYYIEDMNSTNGTFVNDEMLSYKEKRALQPGDIIHFADVRYRFW